MSASPALAGLERKAAAFATMAGRCGIGVDEVGVSFLVPSMELQNEFTTALHSLVQLAMGMFRKCIEPEQLLIPTAARANIAHRD